MHYLPGDSEKLASNLKSLCQRHGSIAEICRKLDINRQQFNKYLSGAHIPSSSNLMLIANYFGIGIPVLFSDPDEFRMLVDGNLFHALSTARQMPEFAQFMANMVLRNSVQDNEILGVYDKYQYSSIYKGSILKSAFCIYRNKEFLQHYFIERFPSLDNPNQKTEYVFKYYGFCFVIADRIFMADFEKMQRNEITFGVYTQVKRNPRRFMFGITSGVSANTFRQPYATRVALHYRGPGLIEREHIGSTVMDRTDPSIPREALQFLGDGSDMIHMS